MRGISSQKKERVQAAKTLNVKSAKGKVAKATIVKLVGEALYFSFITAYAQGLALLSEASKENKYGLDLEATARIWRGGCIIRAALLEDIRKAYADHAELPNLMVDKKIARQLKNTQKVDPQCDKKGD